ncbi:MAG: peptidase C15 [Prochlorotrichaceae cyanobacterium]
MDSLLLTSFDTWLPHHALNSSDVLLEKLNDRWQGGQAIPPAPYHLLRRLPVDSDRAMEQIEQRLRENPPRLIICCGMAEKRNTLDLERQAYQEGHTLQTRLDLRRLAEGLHPVALSEDAGRFVCNTVYYRVLNLLLLAFPQTAGLFVHVPLLPPAAANWSADQLGILAAFELVLSRSFLS